MPSGYSRWYLYSSLLGTDWASVTPSAEMMAPRGSSIFGYDPTGVVGVAHQCICMEHLEIVEHGEERHDKDHGPDAHRPHAAVDPDHRPGTAVSTTDQPLAIAGARTVSGTASPAIACSDALSLEIRSKMASNM